MEPFKTLLCPAVVQAMGAALARAGGQAEGFADRALAGLEVLEMKARARHIAAALAGHLPGGLEARLATLEAMLHPDQDGAGPLDGQGLRGWAVWPLTMVVADEGLADPGAALASLRQMTMRFTSGQRSNTVAMNCLPNEPVPPVMRMDA